MFMIEPWHWLVLGMLLLALEILIPTFALLIFGSAALLIALISWIIPLNIIIQILLWLVLSVSVAIFWFKYFKPKWEKDRQDKGIQSLVGQTAMITEIPKINHKGRVRFTVPVEGVDEWDCLSQDDLKIGDKVIVNDAITDYLVVSKV